MKRQRNFILTVIIVAAFALLPFCSRQTGKKVVVKGSTTVLPITQKAAEAYREAKKVLVTVEGSGSGNGIKALLDGTCDIANASRAMKGKELKIAKAKGMDVRESVVAFDMIVPVVHPDNKIKNLTLSQLKAIYDGSISNWKQLGGKDERIVVISRDTSSGTYEVWPKMVMKKNDVRKDALLQASNGAIVAAVSQNPKAIGYIGFGYMNNSVKPLLVNNVVGTLKNGKMGKYPISRKLFMYINKKRMSAETRGFVDFLLGVKGQALVKEAGFIPL
jgi:phosphate transport system substrate-binding protein